MRISGGRLKGRKVGSQSLFAKKSSGDELRPTSSKVRQAIFNILRGEIQDASFLDLYAGTGAVGLEAISEGASEVVFVEKSRVRAGAIVKVLRKTGTEDRAEVFQGSATDFLERAAAKGRKFGIIFADPPYASEETGAIVAFIDKYGILDDMGLLMVEHAAKKPLPGSAGRLVRTKTYRYGDTMLTLFRSEA